MSKFASQDTYDPTGDYKLLPFTFDSLESNQYLVTNMVGETLILPRPQLEDLVNHRADIKSKEFGQARASHLVFMEGERAPIELLALKYRTRTQRLKEFTSLHMLVISLRCDHSCPYCQVSRRSEDKARFDMSLAAAEASLDLIYQTPAKSIKIEFQGGEPLLNFDLIKYVVKRSNQLALEAEKEVEYVIATTLSLLSEEILDFCNKNKILLSASLDGPLELHNKNRPRKGRDSYERFVKGLLKARDVLGRDRVSALMTTTTHSLAYAKEIIDEYVALDFNSIFLRPLSPYGFAIRTKAYDSYEIDDWLEFYKTGLDYIISLNRKGVPFREIYTSIILQKILTFDETGFVDLMNPAGIGIAGVVYNYDGDVYASDESRMLAEMGDKRFRLGSVLENTYEEIFGADELISALDESFTLSSPMCYECAFEPFCGADPVFHHGVYGDVVGRKPESAFCKRHMGIFKHLFELRKDPFIADLFNNWAKN